MINNRGDGIQHLRAADGTLHISSPVTTQTIYQIDNEGARAAVLMLERQRRQGSTLVSPQPSRRTSDHLDFRIPLSPHSVQSFTVTECTPVEESLSLADLREDMVQRYLQEKALSVEGRRQLSGLLKKMHERDRASAEADATRKTLSDLADTQDRLRKNIDNLNHVSGEQAQVKAYAAELARQEAQFLQLHQKLDHLQQQTEQLSREITDATGQLNF